MFARGPGSEGTIDRRTSQPSNYEIMKNAFSTNRTTSIDNHNDPWKLGRTPYGPFDRHQPSACIRGVA